jgi:hypothetical protein
MQQPSRWLVHSPMTEPGAFETQIKALPSEVAALNQVVQGLLVHSEWLAAYGVDPNAIGCEFRFNPATDSDFIPATIPI